MDKVYKAVLDEYISISRDLTYSAKDMNDTDLNLLTGWQEALDFVLTTIKEQQLEESNA